MGSKKVICMNIKVAKLKKDYAALKPHEKWAFLEAAMKEKVIGVYGPRCKSFWLSCPECVAWMCYDYLFENDRWWLDAKHQKEREAAFVNNIAGSIKRSKK